MKKDGYGDQTLIFFFLSKQWKNILQLQKALMERTSFLNFLTQKQIYRKFKSKFLIDLMKIYHNFKLTVQVSIFSVKNVYSYYYSKEAKSLGTFVLPASQSCSISLSIRIKFPAYIYNRASWRSWQSTGFPRDRPGFEPGSCRVYLFSSLLIFTGRKNTYSSPKGKE